MAQSIKLGNDTYLDASGVVVDSSGTTLEAVAYYSGATTNPSYISSANIRWVRVGRIVNVSGWFVMSATPSNNTLLFSGLPPARQEQNIVCYDQTSLASRMATFKTDGKFYAAQGLSEASAVGHYQNISFTYAT